MSAGKLGERLLYAVHTADEPLICEVPVTQHVRLAFLNTVAHLWGDRLNVPFHCPVVHRTWATRSARDERDDAEDPKGLVRLDTFFEQELVSVVALADHLPRESWPRVVHPSLALAPTTASAM